MRAEENGGLPPLARSALDRDAGIRTNPERFVALLNDDATRFVLLQGERMLASSNLNGSSPQVALLTRAAAEQIVKPESLAKNPLYLGRATDASRHAGTPIVAVCVEPDMSVDGQAGSWITLRDDIEHLDDLDVSILTTALALGNWHEHGAYSPATGNKTAPQQAGWMREDPQSGAEIFPRTDPAIIVLITDDADRVLLGSHILWDENRYSLLAGFVEAGESLEGAIHREIAEEAGVQVADLRYVASQPWPFPRSLMVGFRAKLARGQDPAAIRPDETELASLRWFTRDEIRNSDTVQLPGRASIARFMLDAWLDESGDRR